MGGGGGVREEEHGEKGYLEKEKERAISPPCCFSLPFKLEQPRSPENVTFSREQEREREMEVQRERERERQGRRKGGREGWVTNVEWGGGVGTACSQKWKDGSVEGESEKGGRGRENGWGGGVGGCHLVMLGMDGENERREEVWCVCVRVLGGLLVHPPEATNALTFINWHYRRCV